MKHIVRLPVEENHIGITTAFRPIRFMMKSTITSSLSPIWLVVISLVSYWTAIVVSRWDFLGNDLANVYSLLFALLPAFILQIAGLCLYILAFKRNAANFKMPNYWIAFIGSLAIIQFTVVGLFLTLGTLYDAGDIAILCPKIPTLTICDISRFTYSRSFLLIQNGLWLLLGLASIKASTKVIPFKKVPPAPARRVGTSLQRRFG